MPRNVSILTVGATLMYNGTGLVATPIILVSANYRLGSLGVPQGIEAGVKQAAHLGLMDQIAGLQWVQANIKAFGGDKSKVHSLDFLPFHAF